MGFMNKLQSKLELFKLEQRYTKRSRRTTFISEAYYVDGEYVYELPPNMTNSGQSSPTGSMKQGSFRVSDKRRSVLPKY